MDQSELERHVFAYYVANGAEQLNMVGRFWPHGELVMLIQDKIQVAVRKFGSRATRASANVARSFVDQLVERNAFSSVKQDLGGTMHQFQAGPYRDCINEWQQTNPIIAESRAAEPDYWENAFARLAAPAA